MQLETITAEPLERLVSVYTQKCMFIFQGVNLYSEIGNKGLRNIYSIFLSYEEFKNWTKVTVN